MPIFTPDEEPIDQGRFADLEPIGVIDIGSNSVRLVVYEGAVRAPTPLFNEKEMCGLGRAVAATGRLGAEAIEKTIRVLQRFHAVARVMGVKNLWAFATAAVRDAADGREFLAKAEAACGVSIQLLSGEREAELASHGITMGFGDAGGVAGDLGGGSLELVDRDGAQRRGAVTLPLGGLRMSVVTGGKLDKAVAIADEQFAQVNWLSRGRGRPFFAVGGTWRALAKLHMVHNDYPLRVMQGYTINTREAMEFCAEIRKKRLSGIRGGETVARVRREVLPYGAIVLERLLKRMEPSSVVFSVFGIREGVLYDLMPAHERRKDPLLSFCLDYARLRSRSARHAQELCRWTDPLFESPALRETAEERRLRHAACLLSDIGWREHPDYRGDQSLNLIAHAALAGIDHPGRLFLALAVYFRHAGPGESAGEGLSMRLKSRIDRRALKRARILAGAIRTAHMMSMGLAGIIDETLLDYEGARLVLSIPKPQMMLAGDRLQRRLESLARLVDCTPELKIIP
jgi:exopolyphosphatase/guanosine-5'-triphosphate,3'-diphosphate pyrophosphatase